MSRELNLNSTAWCDLIFDGKNKDYGAYEMRQTSSRRHLLAFGFTLIFSAMVAFSPAIMDAVKPQNDRIANEDIFVVSGITPMTEDPAIQEAIDITPPPPPVELMNSLAFTPPKIVDNSEVKEGQEMLSQSELNENKNIRISTHTITNGSSTGQDIADILTPALTQPTPTEEVIHKVVDYMPIYPGGDAELMRFLSSSIKYPAVAAENNIEGRVIVQFVVGKDGIVSKAKILRTADPSLDKEALRVIGLMGKWIPGKQNGKAVSVYYTLPITFKLQK